jgi:predicted pyridoxine 5'-phosphate oxidase superfamily flavin-nucleotide-binding protein
VATADADGTPHLASAARVRLEPDGRVSVAEWFCPATVANLAQNPRVAIVAWDPQTDTGHQIVGDVEALRELAVLDGDLPGEEKEPAPQVEHELLVRVRDVLAFRRAPHTDLPE